MIKKRFSNLVIKSQKKKNERCENYPWFLEQIMQYLLCGIFYRPR